MLAVPGEGALREVSCKLAAAGCKHRLVAEPDAPWSGQAMALGCDLLTDRTRVRKVVSNLPLLR